MRILASIVGAIGIALVIMGNILRNKSIKLEQGGIYIAQLGAIIFLLSIIILSS